MAVAPAGAGGRLTPGRRGVDGGYRRIYAVVRRIPRGRVATYGQVARLAGLPGQARQVGYALSALADDAGVPWHRVINAKGQISRRKDSSYEKLQRALLKEEGVPIGADGRTLLARCLWRPKRASRSAGEVGIGRSA